MNLGITSYQLMRKLGAVRYVVFDFDGTMTNGFVDVGRDGLERVRCSRKDGLGIEMLKKAGLTIFVLSTESDPVVEMRCRKLGVRCEQGVGDKGHYLNLRFTGLLGTLLYMGDDINDLECLKLASVAVTVADGHPDCKAVAHYVTVARGGDHAVREVCDLILEARKET